MRDFKYTVLGVFVFFLVVLGIGAAVYGADFFLYKWFAPAKEEARRETFENSTAHVQSVLRDMNNMRLEYLDPHVSNQQRQLLLTLMRERSLTIPPERVPPDLQSFLSAPPTVLPLPQSTGAR